MQIISLHNNMLRRALRRSARALFVLWFCVAIFAASCFADEWDDWGDSEAGGPVIRRPFVTGWWDWKYNEFSSYDQGRINFEREFGGGQKLLAGANFNYYTEDNNKKWVVFPGENYYSFKAGAFNFKIGAILENIGSGDKFSFVDKINSRRFHNGLANDYDKDKKEIPAVKASWYINKHFSLSGHYLPYFSASEFPNIYSRWAYAIHKTLANEILFNGAKYTAEDDSGFDPQFHVEFSSTFRKFELRLHYLRLKERLPVISQDRPGFIRGSYPLDETIAVNGNVQLLSDLLIRYEFAFNRNKTWTSYYDGRIGKKFVSDQYALLLGTDKNLPRNFYVNVQTMMSYVPDLLTQTPFQLAKTEYMGSLQLRQNFRRDRLKIELNGLTNFTTGEYVLTPKIFIVQSDYLTFVFGYQANGEGAESLGPVAQFSQNNTAFFETNVTF
ncbi:MAG: hypothetical protein Kow0029_26240 [Candidatus Rifleibacteriota bacterium]